MEEEGQEEVDFWIQTLDQAKEIDASELHDLCRLRLEWRCKVEVGQATELTLLRAALEDSILDRQIIAWT